MTDLVEGPEHPHDPDLRCAPWTQAQAVDPIGSAGSFDALLLVEWPLPWPHDVGEIPALAEAVVRPGARVMTVVPRHDESSDGLLRVVHRRRTGTNALAGVDHRVPVAEIPALLTSLLEHPLADSAGRPTAVGEAPPEVLVCAHGRRDPCCGRWGTLLHVELAARWSDVRVWRCSHTGGHRFAPTAITLPDGRAWAYVDADLLDGVVHRTADVRGLADHDRGTTGLGMWAQVVERALLAEHGWQWLATNVTRAETTVAGDGRSAEVRLEWEGGRATGTVEVTRILPVLTCGEPPERARKSAPELRLRSLERE
jgi:hypothetical protein